MKKLFTFLLMIVLFSGCVEARKGGDQNRKIIKGITSKLKAMQLDVDTEKLDAEAKENLENPPTIGGGAANTIVSGLEAANGIGSIWYGAGVASMIAGVLKLGGMYLAGKRKAEETEIENEADRIIPQERHEEWASAVKQATVKVLAKKKGIT